LLQEKKRIIMLYLKDASPQVAEIDAQSSGFVDAETTFPALFSRHVRSAPNKAAIVTTTSSISYGALNEQAEQIAATLLAYSTPEAEAIALFFEQEIAAFAATIGVLQSGNFYVTLDPRYPMARLTEILADSGAAILLTNNRCAPLVREFCPEQIKIINIDALPLGIPMPLPVDIAADAYAYIGYTSGSTGKAKGVIETHRNHLCHWQNLRRAQPTYGNERVLFLNRLSFSGGQLAFYMTFLAGATLYLYDLQEESIAQLPSWIQKQKITVWNSVPTVFRAFVAQVTSPRQVASIRLLRLASDSILAQDIDAYRQLFAPNCKLWFCYALTEAKTVTMAFLDRKATISPVNIPSGTPIEGMEIRIVDERGQQLGPHQVGEIIVRSRYVSPGYWQDADLTATRFSPDPQEEGLYLLRTGDLGKVDEQGCLFHKGRKDSQIKIRGYRVELSEIEAHLAALDGMQEAAVRTHTVADGDLRLAAYLVSSDAQPPSSSQLRTLLEARLPSYMIPNSFTLLTQMPVNRNGKVDRAALPIPAPSRPASDVSLITARTPLEERLTNIWQSLLGVDPIGIHDNFFDLGGHSLLAVTLFEEVAKATGKTLPISVVLQAPTIAQQAARLEQPASQSPWSSLVAVRATGTRPPLFLVPPAYGTALSFIKLARYLDAEQPIYAFDPVGLDGEKSPLTTVEAMAAHYISEMRSFQPEGPYRLGGKCMGGVVALEMTRQLLDAGSTVETLIILDSTAPRNGPTWQRTPPPRTLRHYRQRLQERIATRTLHVVLTSRWKLFKKAFLRSLGKQGRLEEIREAHNAAQIRYTATPTPQHIFVVQSEELANRPGNQPRWSALALGGITYHVVAGSTHFSILAENEAHISLLARYLQTHLNQHTQQSTPEPK